MQKLMSVTRTLDGMIENYDVLGEDTASLTQEKDPNLTVNDMREKAENIGSHIADATIP
ncbi:hypothetical protein Pst134EA_017316 [Puccinia striiformis f. sp. tritici]|uniref:hypothetical protein n=1 Tax=Puccinia striiformis f. sp. tritici TaxID=168172 RepID=UPI002008E72F|nr:hypothetical protein Pst134EA_017316 [Puccinia striiformis f. sp. tritici]KAH9461005.1 hypothetical protein Pst134EA_017316 [Puccinia striiformis f. sp. tritici]